MKSFDNNCSFSVDGKTVLAHTHQLYRHLYLLECNVKKNKSMRIDHFLLMWGIYISKTECVRKKRRPINKRFSSEIQLMNRLERSSIIILRILSANQK